MVRGGELDAPAEVLEKLESISRVTVDRRLAPLPVLGRSQAVLHETLQQLLNEWPTRVWGRSMRSTAFARPVAAAAASAE